jgi:hypothetical protein
MPDSKLVEEERGEALPIGSGELAVHILQSEAVLPNCKCIVTDVPGNHHSQYHSNSKEELWPRDRVMSLGSQPGIEAKAVQVGNSIIE